VREAVWSAVPTVDATEAVASANIGVAQLTRKPSWRWQIRATQNDGKNSSILKLQQVPVK